MSYFEKAEYSILFFGQAQTYAACYGYWSAFCDVGKGFVVVVVEEEMFREEVAVAVGFRTVLSNQKPKFAGHAPVPMYGHGEESLRRRDTSGGS